MNFKGLSLRSSLNFRAVNGFNEAGGGGGAGTSRGRSQQQGAKALVHGEDPTPVSH